jgi:hypothetical protein
MISNEVSNKSKQWLLLREFVGNIVDAHVDRGVEPIEVSGEALGMGITPVESYPKS